MRCVSPSFGCFRGVFCSVRQDSFFLVCNLGEFGFSSCAITGSIYCFVYHYTFGCFLFLFALIPAGLVGTCPIVFPMVGFRGRLVIFVGFSWFL